MARARNIKPSFFTNDELAEIEPLGRLLFIALWTLADRDGRLEDRPKRIKAEALPYDQADAESLLDSLHAGGFILRYASDGNKFIQVLNFAKHQNPHIKEAVSTIPAPCKTRTGTVHDITRTGTSRADSLLLIPDSPSLIPDTNNPPNPPDGGCEGDCLGSCHPEFYADTQSEEEPEEPGEAVKAEKPKRHRKPRTSLKTFIDHCRTTGEKPISDHAPLLTYMDSTGLPTEFIQICWSVFKGEFLPPGEKSGRLQADWRGHFMNYVRKGYYRLWYAKDGTYVLSTAGVQAQLECRHKEAA